MTNTSDDRLRIAVDSRLSAFLYVCSLGFSFIRTLLSRLQGFSRTQKPEHFKNSIGED